ncbi:Outer membrane protein Omp38 [Flagellimonas maritima]|uniref:Outer membrane protein Omp38 n=1 Tax=Flagellimonas maritima TaxID=1383885 RepID=A0A2Z4LU91_9FLAO|nr:DUF5723 family protein [Allomuricauda aurantiaca]AWX44928.1 Outer membrane protein Omp38 [Allomuricauda aurantiaca]
MKYKKIALVLFMVFMANMTIAQSYKGFLEDNYNGVHGVLSNPANIADSRMKLDINLIGVSAFFGNDYIKINLGDAIDDIDKVFDKADRTPSQSNFMANNLDILGPSFMLSLNKENSIAIYSRARSFFNIINVNGDLLDKEGGFNEDESFIIDEGSFSGALNVWTEFGLTYARTLLDKEQHFLKGGITFKYLIGAQNAYTQGENVQLDYDANTRSITTSGQLTYGEYDFNTGIDLDNFLESSNASGFGFDLGLVYEWRPENKTTNQLVKDGNPVSNRGINKYKLKFGASITDISKINNRDGVNGLYDLNKTQSIDNFDGQNLEEAIRGNFDLIGPETSSADSHLPAALHSNLDWNINSSFYLNLNTDLSLVKANKLNSNRILNEVSLSPRFESKWLSIYSPLRLVQDIGFLWGAGLRAGPLYIGSGSVFSALISDNSQSLDFYAGLKVPIYQKTLKDKDNDGIEDKSDNCPKIAGPIENNGCPWGDKDGDGVLDKDDDCPDIAGSEENKGCPWKDTDKDGILDKDDDCPNVFGKPEFNGCPDQDNDGLRDQDDRCPEIAGKLENKGCPDSDGDSIVDIDDACPTVAGTIENNGCPEVTAEVQKQLNDYARTILFDTGKSSIKTESVSVMVDIIQILNEYPNAKFTVEGHTDSVGSSASNQKLSESRADSVRDFLINEGIKQDRLKAMGYGEEIPIASNKTSLGRKQNRRVEINLIK